MEKVILDFISKNKIATVCCLDDQQQPYCFNCFYVFEPTQQLLLFKSSENTFHTHCLNTNNEIAGTILPGTINFPTLKGIQFTGKICREDSLQLLSSTN